MSNAIETSGNTFRRRNKWQPQLMGSLCVIHFKQNIKALKERQLHFLMFRGYIRQCGVVQAKITQVGVVKEYNNFSLDMA